MNAALFVAGVGLIVAFIGWTQPPTIVTSEQSANDQTMTFSYSAGVAPSPAYQGIEVRSPDPVFRKQTNLVDVEFAYEGVAATVTADVQLSTSNGWRWTLPPGVPVDASSGSGKGTVNLDLDSIQKLASAGAVAAGIPASNVTIKVIPAATSATGDFEPELTLNLTEFALTLEKGEGGLVVAGSQSSSVLSPQPNSVSLLGIVSIGIWPMRIVGLMLLVLGGLSWLLLRNRRPPAGVVHTAAVKRHRELIIKVEAVDVQGMLIEVADLDSLVRLAKRYALMILEVSRPTGDTFYVQDESVTYRWKPGPSSEWVDAGAPNTEAGDGSAAAQTLVVDSNPRTETDREG